ncbi:MAG: phage tail tape measure protein [Clostridia bacterium]|nr:phage tail tape measure protein [Clostridia bacterium]
MANKKTLSTVFKAVDQFTPVAAKVANAGKSASKDVKQLKDTLEKGADSSAFKRSASTIETALKEAENSGVRSVKSIESAIERGFSKSTSTIVEMTQKYEALQIDFDKSQSTIQSLETKVRSLETEIEKLGKSSDDTKDKFEGLGDSASGITDTIKTLAGTAAAFFGVSAVGEAVDNEMKAVHQFQARVGATAVEMAEYKSSIKELYNDAMGESIEDVSNSMATVKVNTGLIGKELKNTTNTALLLRDTFEFDVNESTRSAKMMMDQFGLSAEQSYNLIAQGAQNGLDKNGDLLDTINEYAVHFKQLGFDAEDMLNMLANGTANGTFSVDKLGDSIKEFGIRVIDGSDTTKEGFKAIGLNADKMAEKFTTGGETAKEAFTETVTALKNMKDPIEQNTAGVNLFGTMWEDLGSAGVFALSNLNGKISETSNALKDIEAIKYQDIGSSLTSLGRGLMSDFTDGFMADSGTIVSQIEDVGTALSPTIKELGETTASAIELASDALGFACEHADEVKVTVGSIIGMVTAKKTLSSIAKFSEGLGASLKATSVLPSATTKAGGALTTFASGLGSIALPATLAAGAISAVAVGFKAYEDYSYNKSIEEHFGNISLSLSEMETMADKVVTGGNLSKIRQSLEEFEELKNAKESIDDITSNLDKLDWKVEMGFELSSDETKSYKESIDSYISEVQSYAEQQHYSATVAVNVLFGENDPTGQGIIDNINDFYSGKELELQKLGNDLAEVVNKALEGNILSPEEVSLIENARKQIAEIEASLADDKLNSGLEGAKTDFSYKDITSESAAEYAEIINKTVAETVDAYAQNRDMAITPAASEDEKKSINNNYLELKGSAIAKGSSTVNSTIYQNYEAELKAGNDYWNKMDLSNLYKKALEISESDITKGYIESLQESKLKAEALRLSFNENLSLGDRSEISKLYEEMEPQHEELLKLGQSYIEAGETIPDGIRAGILDNAKVGAVLSDENSLYTLIAYNSTKQNPDYVNMILKAKASGVDIDESILLGIELAKPGTIEAAEKASQDTIDKTTTTIEDGRGDIEKATKASVEGATAGYTTGFESALPKALQGARNFVSKIAEALSVKAKVNNGDGIVEEFSVEVENVTDPGDNPLTSYIESAIFNETGGIYDRPTLTWVAEAGDREAIIPLNDTQRAYDLWQEAGQAIGVARGYTGTAFTDTAFDGTPKSYNVTSTNFNATEKNIVLRLEGGGEIKIPKTLNKEDIVKLVSENIEPILLDIIHQELFEEGDGTYET